MFFVLKQGEAQLSCDNLQRGAPLILRKSIPPALVAPGETSMSFVNEFTGEGLRETWDGIKKRPAQ
jgi:hypothetical protein